MENNLILRHSTPADADQLEAFNSRIHYFVPEHERTIPAMTRDLLSGRHPAFRPDDFTLVVEKKSGRIVSAMGLISQTWSYGGIPVGVGRPELVGTHPDYRGQGLIREQFRDLHASCRERGQVLQAITGIPFFYRQFGYELGLGSGAGLTGAVPQQNPGGLRDGRDYRISPAGPGDLGWIQASYQNGCGRYLLACVRDLKQWQYELCEKSGANIHKVEIYAITTPQGEAAGFFVCPKGFGKVTEKLATWYELLPGFSWELVTPAVLRFLAQAGQAEADQRGGVCGRIGLTLGENHPAYASAGQWLTGRAEPGAWYVRVPDLAGFIDRISPVLNERLDKSAWAGFSGTLKISSYYKDGICLGLHQGFIEKVSPYRPAAWEDADAAFPYLTFLQLLFGYRSLRDLRYAYADCWCKPELQGLVETLFPVLGSFVWGIA